MEDAAMNNLIYALLFLLGALIGTVILFVFVKTSKKRFEDTVQNNEREWNQKEEERNKLKEGQNENE